MRLFILFSFLLFVFICKGLPDSKKDTSSIVKSAPPVLFYSFNDSCGQFMHWDSIDHSLNYFHFTNYLENTQTGLGHVFSPQKGLIYGEFDYMPVLNNMIYYSSILSNSPGIRYYNVRIPFTEINYFAGSKGEQTIDLIHTQNVFKNFNIAAQLKIFGEQGYYARQNTSGLNASSAWSFLSGNKRYGMNGSVIFNKISIEENGGIENDSLFNEDTKSIRTTVPVSLNDAENHIKQYSFFLYNYFNLGSLTSTSDTIHSTYRDAEYRIGHKLQTESGLYDFYSRFDSLNDLSDSLFFSQFFPVDTMTLIYDSIQYIHFLNEMLFEKLGSSRTGNKSDFRFCFSIRHDLYNYKQYLIDSSLQNISFRINLFGRFGKSFSTSLKGHYTVFGYNQEDYFISPSIRWRLFHSKYYCDVAGQIRSSEPALDERYYSNQFMGWKRDLNRIYYLKAQIRLLQLKRKSCVFASVKSYQNFLYYDSDARPQQFDRTMHIFHIGFEKMFKMNKFHLRTNIVYQKSSDLGILSLPLFVTFNSFYFETQAFNKSIKVRIGIDALYYSKYYADSWMPMTRQFYIQSSEQTGNYPYAGFLLAAKIKQVRVFFRVNHPYAGLLGYQYYAIPHYPMPDMSLRFGLSWRLYD